MHKSQSPDELPPSHQSSPEGDSPEYSKSLRSAIEQLANDKGSRWLAMARGILKCRHLAEDAIGTVLYRILRRKKQIRLEDLEKYIWVSIHNECVSILRGRSTRRETISFDEENYEGLPFADARASELLLDLDDRTRSIVCAHIFERAAVDEIAARSRMTTAEIQRLLHVGLARLQVLLQKENKP